MSTTIYFRNLSHAPLAKVKCGSEQAKEILQLIDDKVVATQLRATLMPIRPQWGKHLIQDLLFPNLYQTPEISRFIPKVTNIICALLIDIATVALRIIMWPFVAYMHSNKIDPVLAKLKEIKPADVSDSNGNPFDVTQLKGKALEVEINHFEFNYKRTYNFGPHPQYPDWNKKESWVKSPKVVPLKREPQAPFAEIVE
jgi:hypothetical protein